MTDDNPRVPALGDNYLSLFQDKGHEDARAFWRVRAFAAQWAYWRTLGRLDLRASRFDVGLVSRLTLPVVRPAEDQA